MNLSFEKASAIDLAGRDVFEAVTMSVTPKVIETDMTSAVAKDGIELLVKARVTVRTNLERLIGGAGEATILARVGEGIVTTVGSSRTHSEVLENPDDISRVVLEKGLDSGTAFEIISIDVADIYLGSILVQICRVCRLRLTIRLRRPGRKRDVRWRWLWNRK